MSENEAYSQEYAFDREMAARIRSGKYTRWASDLTNADLFAVIWYVGELACRSGQGKQFESSQWPAHFEAGIELRQHIALDVLCQTYCGRRFSDCSLQSIREAFHEGMQTRTWNGEIIEPAPDLDAK